MKTTLLLLLLALIASLAWLAWRRLRGEHPVQGAMRDLLRQRLWLRDHAADASLDQLRSVRGSLDAARGSLEQQLARIDRARAGKP